MPNMRRYQVLADSWGSMPTHSRGEVIEVEDGKEKEHAYDLKRAQELGIIVEVDQNGAPVERDEDDPLMASPTPVGQLPVGDEKAIDRGAMAGATSVSVPPGSEDGEATVVEMPTPEDDEMNPEDEKPKSRKK